MIKKKEASVDPLPVAALVATDREGNQYHNPFERFATYEPTMWLPVDVAP